MQLSTLVTLALAAASAAGATTVDVRKRGVAALVTAPEVIPETYQQVGVAPAAKPLTITLPLKGARADQLEARMLQISRSGGAWLSPAELATYTAPAASDLASLKAFLTSNGVAPSNITFGPNNQYATVKTDTAQVAKMFAIPKLYKFNVGGRSVTRAKQLTIPSQLAYFVNDVQPLTSFNAQVRATPKQQDLPPDFLANITATTQDLASPVHARDPRDIHHHDEDHEERDAHHHHRSGRKHHDARKKAAAGKKSQPKRATTSRTAAAGSQKAAASTTNNVAKYCNKQTGVTQPDCLRALIGTDTYVPKPSSDPNYFDVTVVGLINSYVDPADLQTFMAKFRSKATNPGFTITNAPDDSNPNDPSQPSLESSLDMQYVVSQNYPLNNEFLLWGPQDGDIFEEALAYILQRGQAQGGSLPGVVSVSYGAEERGFTTAEASALCSTAQQLTALGTTVVFASGDNGVDGIGGASCASGFVPTYPSGCPYILSAGGTQGISPEVVLNGSGGLYPGGGFSNLFPLPSWQVNAVRSYLRRSGVAPSTKYYNKNGRGYPDLSAQAANYPIVVGGELIGVGGTSASAPTIASVISLVNDARRQNGKGPVGWINPKMYASPGTFSDITSGKTKGCPGAQANLGYAASAGWDAASGLGTLTGKFAAFMALLR